MFKCLCNVRSCTEYFLIYTYIYIYIYWRFRGVSPACPTPVTGRSASFRLRFRFVPCVPCVRAGEAKLCVRVYNVVLIAGPPGCSVGGVSSAAVLFSLIFCAQAHGF